MKITIDHAQVILYNPVMSGLATIYSTDPPTITPKATAQLPDTVPDTGTTDRRHLRLGELLLDAGLITERQLQDALNVQFREGGKIARILISLGYLDLRAFLRFMAKEAGVGSIDLMSYEVRSDCVTLVPRDFAERHELLAVEKLGRALTVAMVCPLNHKALYEVENMTGLKARPVMCTPDALWYTIKRHYPDNGSSQVAARAEDDSIQWLERQFLTASVVGLVRRTESLGRLPKTRDALRDAMQDPLTTPKDIMEIVGRDPALAAKVLSAANVESLGFAGRVDTLDLAVRLLGPRETFLIADRADDCAPRSGESGLVLERYVRDARFCAKATERIAQAMGLDHLSACAAAGLLSDLGRLVLARVAPNHYRKLDPELTNEDLIAAEQKCLGISHSEAGYMLAERWGLPRDISEAILFHHEPKRAARAHQLVAAVSVAQRLASLYGATVEEGRVVFKDCLELLQNGGLSFRVAAEIVSELSRLREDSYRF